MPKEKVEDSVEFRGLRIAIAHKFAHLKEVLGICQLKASITLDALRIEQGGLVKSIMAFLKRSNHRPGEMCCDLC